MSFGYRTGTNSGDISKIYLIGDLLIRTTPGSDIRLYDIANISSVHEISKIAIEGNNDVAVSGHYMYADHRSDLVVFDIASSFSPVAIDTIKNVFSQYMLYDGPINEGVGNSSGGMRGCNGCGRDEVVYSPVATADNGGQGGSLARFVIVGDHLYCIDASSLKVFDISDPARPRFKNTVSVNWNIETIFNAGSRLFIGGNSGMYIYDITDPDSPTYLSEFTHARSCDPVVVEGTRAYVTLRGGSPCGGYSNQMDILDIGDIRNPKLLVSVPLTGPYGLAVRDSMAIVCDGTAGLKILDAHSTDNVHQTGSVTGIIPHDVILRDDLLVVTGEDGYYIYDASDIANPKPFGKLP
jgi:hypothetical protein